MTSAGIMQPYFFPYLGYFGLIKHTDRFILFDTPQFMRHGWVDRNRVLKAGEGWLYLRPALVKAALGTAIKDVRIDNTQPWRQKIVAQLDGYRKVAPHFRRVRALVEEAIAPDFENIAALDRATLQAVCDYLGINRKIEILSDLALALPAEAEPDEWALNICLALGINEYRNPPGGLAFFDASKYERAGVELLFQRPLLPEYDQRRTPFEPGLSIIDAMMFNQPEVVSDMLDSFELVRGGSSIA